MLSISYMSLGTQNWPKLPDFADVTSRSGKGIVQGYITITKTQDKPRRLIPEPEIFNPTMCLLCHLCF